MHIFLPEFASLRPLGPDQPASPKGFLALFAQIQQALLAFRQWVLPQIRPQGDPSELTYFY